MKVQIKQSTNKAKKFMAVIAYVDENNKPRKKTIHFGASDYEDYTMHKDNERKENYIQRHKKRENWNLSGVLTAGFWSKHLLWNQETIKKSINDIEQKYKSLDITYYQ